MNLAEAAVVVRIYELFTGGMGLASIAHTLNSEAALSPRAQQGRVTGWCASSIREVLRRPLYRGEIVYGKVRKRNPGGQVRPRRQPESEWLRMPLRPDLRIVPADLAESVESRFAKEDDLRVSKIFADAGVRGAAPTEGNDVIGHETVGPQRS